MKILIVIGMIIVFISAFFILFIFETSVRNNVLCFTDSDVTCGAEVVGTMITGLLMIGMFILVDAITVYIIVNTAMSEPEAF